MAITSGAEQIVPDQTYVLLANDRNVPGIRFSLLKNYELMCGTSVFLSFEIGSLWALCGLAPIIVLDPIGPE